MKALLLLLVLFAELNVRDFGARGDGVTDDTTAFQRAIDAASAIPAKASWKDDTDLHTVKLPCVTKGYLIRGQLVLSEGVVIVGENVNGSRLWLTGEQWPKIRNLQWDSGTTQQFAWRHTTFMLAPTDIAALSKLKDASVFEIRRGVEFWLEDNRFVLHAAYAATPPWSIKSDSYTSDITAIYLRECGAPFVRRNTFDLGGVAVRAAKLNSFGCVWGQFTGNYFYGQGNVGLDIADSRLNTISANVFDFSRHNGLPIRMSATTKDNTLTGNVVSAKREAVLDGKNVFAGNVGINK